jgi:hypothetical protein
MVVLKFNVYSAKDMEGKLMRTLKQKISVSLDEDIITKIKELSELDDRPLSQYINIVLKKYIKQYDQNHIYNPKK